MNIGETLLPHKAFKVKGNGALQIEQYIELLDKLYKLKSDDQDGIAWQIY